MKINILNYLVGTAFIFSACTDLEVKETDSLVISEDGNFGGVVADAALDGAYNNLNWGNTQENLFALTTATTDELFIPTRGTDWGDNGVWRDLARHAWSPSHLYNDRTWNYLNGNVYRTNQILHETTTKTPLQEAEAKFIRAYNMFWILDLWRQVPFRDADEGPEITPSVLTAQEAFDFIIADLEAALDALPATGVNQIGAQNRASKASANYMLAKLYLNKHVYLGGEPQTADMDKVVSLVDAIAAEGYTLHEGFFEIFSPEADSETIFWANAQYQQRIWGSLHYGQGRETDNVNGGWNGFATTAEFYAKFEGPENENPEGGPQEERRGYVPTDGLGVGFLIGTQYGPESPNDEDELPDPVLARSGQPLIFTKEVMSLTGQPDYTGIRLLKWHPGIRVGEGDEAENIATVNMAGSNGNHLVLMRYADALLMKVEALFRNDNAPDALTLINELRVIREATPLGTLTEQDILDERGRELYLEGWRRNDLVRFGQFNTQFGFNQNTDETRNIYPIPDNALGSNPNLVQNPGYN